MKSPATTALLADEKPARAAAAPKYSTANADGIFEDAEQIYLPMSAGNICHFLLAAVPAGFIPGFRFFMRSPKNRTESLPRKDGGAKRQREAALADCVSAAMAFFSDHHSAVERIWDWAAMNLPADWIDYLRADIGVSSVLAKMKAAKVETPAAPVAAAPATAPVDPFADGVLHLGAISLTPGSGADYVPTRPHYAEIPVADITPNPANPRKDRKPEDVAELAASIAAAGLLQPIAVRDMGTSTPVPNGRGELVSQKRYQLIFGEGRLLAHQALKRELIEAKVYTGVDAAQVLAFALVENLQRRDMNALDEAEGFAALSRLGWTPARMAEQTGKDKRTIRRSLALMKLPDQVRELLRSQKLSPRQARELTRWVVPPGFVDEQKEKAFTARPEVCVAIAAAAVAYRISSDELAAESIPHGAIGWLLQTKLLHRVPAEYWQANLPALDSDFVQVGQAFFCWSAEKWKAHKKQIDSDNRAAADAAREKAEAKVRNKVSVPVAELARGKVAVVELHGDEAKYADYLPDGACSTAIAANGAEVVVCLRPADLRKLKDAEGGALAKDREDKVGQARIRATAKLKKLRKVGPREMALLMECSMGSYAPDSGFDESAFEEQGIRAKKLKDGDFLGTGRAYLSCYTAEEQVRLYFQTLLLLAEDKFLLDLLRWILETDKLGLIEEDKREHVKLLERLSAELWPRLEAGVKVEYHGGNGREIGTIVTVKKYESKMGPWQPSWNATTLPVEFAGRAGAIAAVSIEALKPFLAGADPSPAAAPKKSRR